eukprot:Sspe_Gene.28595::Locus_13075_Transcript_2_2_Confidence_0.667_Length_3090::g.28595::m.28595
MHQECLHRSTLMLLSIVSRRHTRLRLAGRRWPLLNCLWYTFRGMFVRGLVWSVIVGVCSTVVRPLLLKLLIEAVEEENDSEVYAYIGGLAASLVVEGVALLSAKHELNDRLGSCGSPLCAT